MEVIATKGELRSFIGEARKRGRRVSFVPTMGALHAGHKACIARARELGDFLVVSIFVNPTQFGPGEDFDAYPRPLDEDLATLRKWQCDLAFVPEAEEVYPTSQRTWVEVEEITEGLCGRFRPGHFRGVATVVAKLFNMVQPDVVVFGQKDAQQALVIKEMASQLDFPIEIILCATVREADGLAVSSRNRYLSREQRERAVGLYRALCRGRRILEEGERSTTRIADAMAEELRRNGVDRIDYVEIVSVPELQPLRKARGKILMAIAAWVDETRLIDNFVLDVNENVEEVLLF